MTTEKQKVIFCEGALKKKGEIVKNWKTRDFILTQDSLEYYKPGDRTTCLGKIDLDNAKIQKVPENNKYVFSVSTPNRVYVLESDSELDMNKWVNAIKDRIPFSSQEREEKVVQPQRSQSILYNMLKRKDSSQTTPERKHSAPDGGKTDFESSPTELKTTRSFTSIKEDQKKTQKSRGSLSFGFLKSQPEEMTPPRFSMVSTSNDSPKPVPSFTKEIPTKIDPKNIDRKFTGYFVNFFSIMSVSSIQEAFMKHLESEANTEPLDFLLDVEKFKCDSIFSISDEDLDLFHHICQEYIDSNSKKEINISAQIKDKILKVHNQNKGDWSERETPIDILESARSLVLGDFKGDVFPRFLASDLGYEAIVKNYNNSKVISIDPSVSVKYKLERYVYGTNFDDTSQTLSFAKALSSKNAIRDSYLSKSWKNAINFEGQIDHLSPMKQLNNEIDLDFKEIKVYLTLIEKENKRVVFRKYEYKKLLSPILHEMKLEYEEKLEYYPALVIGNWLIQWDNFELCIPKRILNNSAIHHTLFPIAEAKEFESSIPKLADLISVSNVTKKYKLKKEKDKNYVNSQEFIEEILKDLDISVSLKPSFERLTQKLKEKGSIELYFGMSPEFQKTFGLKQPDMYFKTHQELDIFVRKLLGDEVMFKERFPEEWEYLKWIDYMFWYRLHIIREELKRLRGEKEPDKKSIEIEEFHESISAPCCEGEKILCPFE